MINKNKSLAWLDEHKKITLDEAIKDVNNPVRGIYGIFVKDEEMRCVYVGRTSSIYQRMFSAEGHITKLMNENHTNLQLMAAVQSGKEIVIKILEKVPFKFDNYYKDMQRLASAENKYIDIYQEKNQCLEQVPEGTRISENEWEDMKLQNSNLKGR
ncbi:hypothetical protein HAHI6034_10555 [Hathewaya histolytica]|uniref:GIY-YIG domain-containing protein n=2 Tax=Hathewaya histolytica TaxID=1498 RepID=A0A4V6KDR8_HATHI|nr:Uncharacterised protein [Hathewaya histolytica]